MRQRNAAVELARAGDYDHVVVNEEGQVERTAASGSTRSSGRSGRRHPTGSLRLTRAGRLRGDRQPAGPRHVEVAVDAAGPAGDRTWTYACPADLARRRAGRGGPRRVGRRRARRDRARRRPTARRRGGQAAGRPGPGRRPAPPAALARAGPRSRRALPRAARARHPGDAPAGAPGAARPRRDGRSAGRAPGGRRGRRRRSLDALATGPRPVRDLAGPREPARGAAAPAGARARPGASTWSGRSGRPAPCPRYERRRPPRPRGGRSPAGGRPADGRPLGPRQRALLAELAAPGRRRPRRRPSSRPATARAASPRSPAAGSSRS